MCVSRLSGVAVVQILKFNPEYVTFEHEGKCYSITSDCEFSLRESSEIGGISFDEV